VAGSKSAAWISSQSLAFAILIGLTGKRETCRYATERSVGGHPSSALTAACPTGVSFGVVGHPDNPGQREPVKADGRSGLQGRIGRTPRLSDEEVVVKARVLFSENAGPMGWRSCFNRHRHDLKNDAQNSDDPGNGS